MESSRETQTSLDELRRIEFQARQSISLDDLRSYFERVQVLRRAYPDDFDLQLFIAEVQDHILERGRKLRQEPQSGSIYLEEDPARTRSAPDDNAELPPGVERLDQKTWQRATWMALFLTVIALVGFFYLIQAARRINFPAAEAPQQQAPGGGQAEKGAPAQNASQTATSTAPTVRLYTDLVPGTVSVDGNAPQDLKDGELQLDSLEPGRHSIKVVGRTGDAAFSYDVEQKTAPKLVGSPLANNVMAVVVSTQDGKARLVTNADQSEVSLDGKSVGQVSADGLALENLGTSDHDLQVTEGKDRQRFVLTYTPAPALTVYVKSDPNAGTAVVVAGEDGVEVYVDDKLYRRKTDRGQIRMPLKVGEYVIHVHRPGFIDPPPQTVEVKKAEETRVEFHLQPVPDIATLQIRSALPGTMVYLDRDLAAAIGADGNATISNVKPGDHIIELRRDQALTKRYVRTFHTADVITLSGPDVTLDKAVVENKPVPAPAPAPPAAAPSTADSNSLNSMRIDGEQVRKGGGFVPYHTPKVPGRYNFMAEIRKSGGLLKHAKLQWYAGYQDRDNYVIFSIDGKRATVREMREGHSIERKVPFEVDPNNWVQVDMLVRQNSIDARVKGAAGWVDLGPVVGSGDFTQGRVGFNIPGSDEIAISNFRFAAH